MREGYPPSAGSKQDCKNRNSSPSDVAEVLESLSRPMQTSSERSRDVL